MEIWMMNHYAAHMRTDKGGRHYWFAKYLYREGHHPVVFSAQEQENLWTVQTAEEIGAEFVTVRIKGKRTGGFSRLMSMVRFYRNVQKAGRQYAKQYQAPDVILASSVHPLTMVAGLRMANHFGVKCICEVRDMWPEAIFTYSKKINRNSLLGKLLYQGEKWIYSRADALIFTQEGGADYIRRHKWDRENGGPIDMRKIFHINNGVDLEAFDENARKMILPDEVLDNPDFFKVVYAGAIRKVNDLGLIVDAAKLIEAEDQSVRFVIFGAGDQLAGLKKRIGDEQIGNIVFRGRVNKQYIPSIDCRADLNLAHWQMTPLVATMGESCNKVFEYCAAGKPMFYTVHPAYGIAVKFDCGIMTEGTDPRSIADGILKCRDLSKERKKELSENSRKAAEYYDFAHLTQMLLEVINYTQNSTEK